jgi:hypothetical protein
MRRREIHKHRKVSLSTTGTRSMVGCKETPISKHWRSKWIRSCICLCWNQVLSRERSLLWYSWIVSGVESLLLESVILFSRSETSIHDSAQHFFDLEFHGGSPRCITSLPLLIHGTGIHLDILLD